MSNANLREALNSFVDTEDCKVSTSTIYGFQSGAHTGWGWAKQRVRDLLAKFPAEPLKSGTLPADALCMFRDGNRWCCVGPTFVNLQESPAGFADTMQDAAVAYLKAAIEHTNAKLAVQATRGQVK